MCLLCASLNVATNVMLTTRLARMVFGTVPLHQVRLEVPVGGLQTLGDSLPAPFLR